MFSHRSSSDEEGSSEDSFSRSEDNNTSANSDTEYETDEEEAENDVVATNAYSAINRCMPSTPFQHECRLPNTFVNDDQCLLDDPSAPQKNKKTSLVDTVTTIEQNYVRSYSVVIHSRDRDLFNENLFGFRVLFGSNEQTWGQDVMPEPEPEPEL